MALHLATLVALRPTPGSPGPSAATATATVMVTRLIDPRPQDRDPQPLPVPAPAPEEPSRAVVQSRTTTEETVVSPATEPAATTPRAAQAAASMPAAILLATLTSPPGSAADQGPRPLADIIPDVPPGAGLRGGSVTLQLVISERGDVEKITVVSATPPGLFEESALAAFSRARYAPALRGGVPVRSDVRYQVEFAPLSTGADTSSKTY